MFKYFKQLSETKEIFYFNILSMFGSSFIYEQITV